jgi:hypothetical protein
MNIGGLDLCDVDLENVVRNPVGSSRQGDSSRYVTRLAPPRGCT